MPLMQSILLNIPTFLLGLILITSSIILSIAGLFVVRRFMPVQKLKLHNDVAGFIFATIGVIYAVLIAFMVVVVWQDFDRSASNATREANCIADVYRDSEAFAPKFRTEVRTAFDKYTDAIINEEWPLLAKGQRSLHVQEISTGIWKMYGSYQPKTETERIFFEETVKKLNEAGELRRQRILDSGEGLHPILWFVLITGGLITLMFPIFFGTENIETQIVMNAMLAALIALILFTILILDFPFSGSVCITPNSFKQILMHLSGT